MTQVTQSFQGKYTQTTNIAHQVPALQPQTSTIIREEISGLNQNIFDAKFSVEETIQQIQNSKVIKIRPYHGSQSLIAKITPKFQNNNFHFFHQSLQVTFLKQIMHKPQPNFVKIQKLFVHNDKYICLMEYVCAGDLQQHVKTNSFMMTPAQKLQKLKWVKNIIKEVINGLETIHEMGYVYRDLKPSNLLINHQGRIKFCDFGFVIEEGRVDNSFCGTPEYMAPQRLSEMKKTTPVSKSIDLWSLGILTYELLTGETPYTYEDNTSELLEEIYNGFISFDEVFPDYVRHFIMNLLQPNPRKRFTLQQVKEHGFLKEAEATQKWWKCSC